MTLLLANTGSVLVLNPTGSILENSNSPVKELLEPSVLHVSFHDMLPFITILIAADIMVVMLSGNASSAAVMPTAALSMASGASASLIATASGSGKSAMASASNSLNASASASASGKTSGSSNVQASLLAASVAAVGAAVAALM